MKTIEKRTDWYQSVEHPSKVIEACGIGSRSMADMDRRWDLICAHTTIEGKRFLDVGCAEGGFLVRAAKAGAGSLALIEIDKTRRERAKDSLAKWGYRARPAQSELCVNTPAADVVICFSMLHYVRHVFWFLDRVCEATNEVLFFEFAVLPEQDDKIVYRGKEKEGLLLPWWLLRDRMSKSGTVEVLCDPDTTKTGRRVIGCLRK